MINLQQSPRLSFHIELICVRQQARVIRQLADMEDRLRRRQAACYAGNEADWAAAAQAKRLAAAARARRGKRARHGTS